MVSEECEAAAYLLLAHLVRKVSYHDLILRWDTVLGWSTLARDRGLVLLGRSIGSRSNSIGRRLGGSLSSLALCPFSTL